MIAAAAVVQQHGVIGRRKGIFHRDWLGMQKTGCQFCLNVRLSFFVVSDIAIFSGMGGCHGNLQGIQRERAHLLVGPIGALEQIARVCNDRDFANLSCFSKLISIHRGRKEMVSELVSSKLCS